MTPTQTGDKPMVTPDAQDRKREALIVRLGAFADLLCQEPLPGASGDVAYDLLRQAAAQIASDRQHIARHREQETREQSRNVGREDAWHEPSERPHDGEPVIAEYNEFDDPKRPIRLQTVWWYEGEWRTYPSLSDRAYVNRWRPIPGPEQPLDTIQRLGQEFEQPTPTSRYYFCTADKTWYAKPCGDPWCRDANYQPKQGECNR